ncbi:MAG: ABC transporter ATP-binding protein [Thermostichales cyanobacterium DRC_bins_46]
MLPAIELKGITKRYPLVLANDGVDLTLYGGEVLGLVGENGAGKSTLMKILYGMVQPDGGEIWLQGRQVHLHSSMDAIRWGIGMVHQHFMLVEPLRVWENVILGAEPHWGGMIRPGLALAKVAALQQQLGFQVDLQARVRDLPVGLRQRVEILKALYRQARILILDEPTAVLTPGEVQELFAFLRRFVAQGGSVIFISHKLDEVMEVADRITVIRDGRVITTVPKQATQPQYLASCMVGREVTLTVNRTPAQPGSPLLTLEQVQVGSQVRGVSLQVRAGEIVGIAGVEGNGQTELVEAIAGLRPYRGEIRFQGQRLPPTPWAVRRWGTSHIPEDRNRRGLVLDFVTRDNAILGDQGQPPFCNRLGLLRDPQIRAHAQGLVERFDVRPRGITLTARRYSGGNAQKLIVGRELTRDPKLLIAAQPTRGVDIGAILAIHAQILQARDQGMGVLLVSADLNEVLSLADRILVMHQGRLSGELPNPPGSPVSLAALGALMAGV